MRQLRDLEPTGPPDRTYKVPLPPGAKSQTHIHPPLSAFFRFPLSRPFPPCPQVVFAGDAAVGKTSFINRITKGVFMSNLSSTLGRWCAGVLDPGLSCRGGLPSEDHQGGRQEYRHTALGHCWYGSPF